MSRDLMMENVRSKLTEQRIKLWLPPYYVENCPDDAKLDELALSFSEIFGLNKDICLVIITELQSHALDKLHAKEIFEQTGVASLKIRCPSQGVGGTRLISVNIKLTDIGRDLQAVVGEKLETSHGRIKLIACGKVVEPHKTLESQNVKNNQQLMALVLTASEEEAEKEDIMHDKIRKIREDAETLINSNDGGFMHMEDQMGNPIILPQKEKQALMLALALHEKGRSALKKENFSEALILFLDADKEFSECTSDLLQNVDNYALLNLDIVWCYLCLKSVMQLPDAERRLQICEANFRKSYGENFDRVKMLKGSAENEKALIMRLHLMQAILYFHQNRKYEAVPMIQQAEIELNGLRVNDGCLNALIEMGYSPSESRIALRASNNNIDSAISYILERRQQKRDARTKSKEQMEFKKILGKEHKDIYIKPDVLQSLVEMGFNREVSVLALAKCNNNVSDAITMLQENHQVLTDELSENTKANTTMIETLVSFGFTSEMAKMALKNTINNQDEALEYLLKLQNEGTYDTILNSLIEIDRNQPGTSGGASSSLISQAKHMKKQVDELKVYKRFAEDLSSEEDSYLDLPLQMEEKLINEYKKIIGNM